jgi:hypothetical protein
MTGPVKSAIEAIRLNSKPGGIPQDSREISVFFDIGKFQSKPDHRQLGRVADLISIFSPHLNSISFKP